MTNYKELVLEYINNEGYPKIEEPKTSKFYNWTLLEYIYNDITAIYINDDRLEDFFQDDTDEESDRLTAAILEVIRG